MQNLHIEFPLLSPKVLLTVLQTDWPEIMTLDLQNTALSFGAISLCSWLRVGPVCPS